MHAALTPRERSFRILLALLLGIVAIRLGFSSGALNTVEAIGAVVIGIGALATGVLGRSTGFAGLDTPFSLGFVTARLFVGWQFLHAGWEKFNEPGWLGSSHGAAAKGFLTGAADPAASSGAHPSVPGWFGDLASNVFLPHSEVMAYFIVLGEVAVGVGLIVGLFTRTAAFFGLTMNLAFLFAGSTGGGISPLMVVAELVVMTGAIAAVQALSADRVVTTARGGDGQAARQLHVPTSWRRVPAA